MKSRILFSISAVSLIALASAAELPDCIDLPWESPNGGETSIDFDRPVLPSSGDSSHPNKWDETPPIAEEVDLVFNDDVPSTSTPDNKTATVTIEHHLGTGLTDTNGNSLDPDSCIELEVCWKFTSWAQIPNEYLGLDENGKPAWLWDGTFEWVSVTSEKCVNKDVCDSAGGCAGR